MTDAERQECVKLMLARYRDALASSSLLPTDDPGQGRVLLFPPEFNPALRELDRCLTLMRHLEHHEYAGTTLKQLRWHMIAWYVDAQSRQTPIYTRRLIKHRGQSVWVKQTTGYRYDPLRHPRAVQSTADLGVTWITNTYRWSRIHLGYIDQASGHDLTTQTAA